MLILQTILWSPDRWFGCVALGFAPSAWYVLYWRRLTSYLLSTPPLVQSALRFYPGLFQFLVLHLHINLSTLGCVLSQSGSSSLTSSPSCSRERERERKGQKKKEKKKEEKRTNQDQAKTKRENWGEKANFCQELSL